MPYAERDKDTGEIVRLYSRPQPDRAVEKLADDHPDVIDFRAPRPQQTPPALADGAGAVTRAEMNALKAYLRGGA